MLDDGTTLADRIAQLSRVVNDGHNLASLEESDLLAMLRVAQDLVLKLETRLELRGGEGEAIHPIARWRRVRGLTQSQLAAAVGISAPAMNRIEHRLGFACRPATRERISALLHVPQDDLRALTVPSTKVTSVKSAEAAEGRKLSRRAPELESRERRFSARRLRTRSRVKPTT